MLYFVAEVSDRDIFIKKLHAVLHARDDIDIFTIKHNALLRVRGL